jgi:superfamily II DNA helicase RecQ
MLKDIRFSNPTLYKIKMGKLDQISKMVYMNTCRRKFILEYLNEKCDFFTCDNCDNCKEQKLTDMTNEFWPIIMKKNTSILGCSNEIKNKYLVSVNTIYKKKDKIIELDLMDTLWNWKNHIEENKIKKEDLSEKLKLKIPTKFIKVISNEPIKEEIDDKIEKYEKMFKNLL